MLKADYQNILCDKNFASDADGGGGETPGRRGECELQARGIGALGVPTAAYWVVTWASFMIGQDQKQECRGARWDTG